MVLTGTFGQDSTRHWSVYTNVFQNVDFSHPRLNVGVEYRSSRYLWRVAGGKFYHNFMYDEATHGWSVDGTFGRLLSNRTIWLGLQAGYANVSYRTGGEFRVPEQPDSLLTYVVDYPINKKRVDLSAVVGAHIGLGRHLWLDGLLGFGLRYKWVDAIGKPADEEVFPVDLTMMTVRDVTGDRTVPIVRCGLFIGYLF